MSTETLTWTLPTTRTDGSPLAATDIASTDIFDSFSATPTVPIGNVAAPAATFTTAVLGVGTHNFTVVVNDTTGHSSTASNVFTETVAATLAPPSPVADLKGTVNA